MRTKITTFQKTHKPLDVTAEIDRLADLERVRPLAFATEALPTPINLLADEPLVTVAQFADELRASRARRAAMLADPNMNPKLRKLIEALQRQVDEMQLPTFDMPTFDETQQPEPVKRTRKRKPTLASVKRQVVKAGIEVARYDYRPDGTISIVPGKPSETPETNKNNSNNSDEWDGVLQ